MKADHPSIKGERNVKIFHWPKQRRVREQKEGWIKDILKGRYPTITRRKQLKIGGDKYRSVTWFERIFMTLLLVRYYVSLGYTLRKFVINNERESDFIEGYVFVCLILLLLALCFHIVFFGCWFVNGLLTGIIAWKILGALSQPLRILFVDRYREDWALYSYNRTLILLFLNYCEIVIGFAYMYLHYGLVRYSEFTNHITTVQEALYFSVVTITTLGYGDMRPISCLGRLCASVETIMGIIMVVGVVGIFLKEQNNK